jgi:hypothetical protein
MKSQPRYSKEEFARRGDDIYERVLRPMLESGTKRRRLDAAAEPRRVG